MDTHGPSCTTRAQEREVTEDDRTSTCIRHPTLRFPRVPTNNIKHLRHDGWKNVRA